MVDLHSVTWYLVPFIFGMVMRFCCDSSDGVRQTDTATKNVIQVL